SKSSAQSSLSDTLDSGTCSDLDGSTPPPLPKKKSIVTFSSEGSSVAGSSINSDDEISCDSLNSSELEEITDSKKHEDDSNIDFKASFKEKQKLFSQKIVTINENNLLVKSNNNFDAQVNNSKHSFIEKLNAFEQKQILGNESKCNNNDSKLNVSKVSFNRKIVLHDINNSCESKENSSSVNQISEQEKVIHNKKCTSVTKIVPILKKTSNLTFVNKENTSAPNEFESVGITESAISESVPRVSNETSSDSEMVNINNNENCVSENSVSDGVEKLVISNSRDHHTGLTKMKFKRKEIHYEDDQHYKFHLNENNFDTDDAKKSQQNEEDDYFAGYKNLDGMTSSATSTIKSSKGTVRGVKNRVRAGIATFLTMPTTKTWQEKEAGKIVMYSTTMGIVRDTYHRCLKVKQILRTHLVKFDDKDVFMSRETQQEFKERLGTDVINVPQIFVEGVHIGDADAIERLNESGELRRILKPYKSPDACTICQVCGGYRLLPCSLCNGSKKSVHRNHFTTELVALKCMNCDEVGLVKCYAC
ncbi:glutaredoxin domain-containing cysteine-rich protein CG31559-like, partial [Diaphorina citri]|uniref:Glutaredoxin domain-containing cysteine-rich protein CG31559-like n=1 Tax=Diaphorina citri TaxID=121845 RepID=A0A1S4EF18_DIACI